MKEFTKEFQLWVHADYGYTFTEYETLTDCLLADKYTSNWYITKWVNFSVDEIKD